MSKHHPQIHILTVVVASAFLAFGGGTHAADKAAVEKAPAAKSKSAQPAKGKSTPAPKLVDINSAGKAELKTLPLIGDAEADKIIAGRPYGSKAHLVTHNIIPRDAYEGLKTLVIARQKDSAPPKPAPSAKK